jgi:CubicO group peptidase (beta-lactamase class C family)
MIKIFNYPRFTIIILLFVSLNIYGQDESLCFPDSVWLPHDSDKEAGYDSQKLAQLNRFIIDSLNTTGLMIVVDGKTLFEYGDVAELSYIASCRKSLLSMMFGKYVMNGTIDLDLTLDALNVNDVDGLLPIERQATIRHLITARSGIYHPRSNDGDDTQYAPERGTVQPGSYFLYNNWDFNAAGGIFEELINKDIYETFEQDVVKPIQMQDFQLDNQHKSGDLTKSKYPAYHFWISTRDMARIGLLMLNDGDWNGVQVIPDEWVKLSTSTITPTSQFNPEFKRDWNLAYGYLWWIWNDDNKIFEGAYYAAGAYGQYLLIIPKLNMVISHKTKYAYKRRTDFPSFRELVYKIIDAKLDTKFGE